ncbi:MAG: hypothetical protein M0Z51_07825 [Propionibacterium sp.]|nr:hypothetical protein [Propionibacterium sp.]
MTEFAVGLLWAAATWRLIMTTARGWQRGRAELTIASLCLAVLVTNFLWRPQVDHLVGEPNVAGLIGRISAVVGLTAFHWVLVTPGRRGRLLSGMFAVVSGAAMTWSWQVAPLHVREVTEYSGLVHTYPSVAVYSVAFYCFVMVSLVQVGVGVVRLHRQAVVGGDRGAGWALLTAVVGCGVVVVSMVLFAADVLSPAGIPVMLHRAGNGLLVVGAALLAAGVLALPIGEWCRGQWQLMRVTPTWRETVEARPDIRLSLGLWDRVFHPDVVLYRRLIELQDAQEVEFHG